MPLICLKAMFVSHTFHSFQRNNCKTPEIPESTTFTLSLFSHPCLICQSTGWTGLRMGKAEKHFTTLPLPNSLQATGSLNIILLKSSVGICPFKNIFSYCKATNVHGKDFQRAKGGGEVEGHWRGANSHLMALLITVKVLEESSAKNEGPQYVWVLKGIKNVSKWFRCSSSMKLKNKNLIGMSSSLLHTPTTY